MKNHELYEEVKQFLTDTPSNMAVVVLGTEEYEFKPIGNYTTVVAEEMVCTKCEAGVATVLTTTGIDNVRVNNHEVISLESFVKMNEWEELLYMTLYNEDKLKPLMVRKDVDGDGIDDLLVFDIDNEQYVIDEGEPLTETNPDVSKDSEGNPTKVEVKETDNTKQPVTKNKGKNNKPPKFGEEILGKK